MYVKVSEHSLSEITSALIFFFLNVLLLLLLIIILVYSILLFCEHKLKQSFILIHFHFVSIVNVLYYCVCIINVALM